jgi:carboxymethylenebutenolidase
MNPDQFERRVVDDAAGPPVTLHVGRRTPDSTAHTVLLLPAVAGVDAYITRRAAQLGSQGYHVAILDYYGRTGATPDLSTPERIGKAVAALDDREVLSDIQRATVWLAGSGSERVGLLGFCIGGTYAILAAAAAAAQPPACAVAYYGQLRQPRQSGRKPVDAIDAASRLAAPLLAHFGDNDRLIGERDIADLRANARAGQRPAEIHTYPGAPHAFDEWHRPAVFRPVAAAEAWRRTLAFLDWHVRDRVPA